MSTHNDEMADRLIEEVKHLRHDIARHVQIATEQAQELEDLRTQLAQANERADSNYAAYKSSEADLAAARALLKQCPPHIRGNVGAWEHIRPKLGLDGQQATDRAIAEGNALLAAIETAIAGEKK